MKIRELINEGYKEAQTEFSSIAGDQLAKEVISQYKELVNKNQVSGSERNIDYWRKQGWDEFNVFVNSIVTQPTKTDVKKKRAQGKSIIVSESVEWLIVIPIDKNASCYYGKKTSWCTAIPQAQHFQDYTNKGILLIYCLRSDGTKWAIASYPDGPFELFDQDDNTITQEQFESNTGLDIEQVVGQAQNHPMLKVKSKLTQDIKVRQESLRSNGYTSLPRDLDIESQLVDLGDTKLVFKYCITVDRKEINNVSSQFRQLILAADPSRLNDLEGATKQDQHQAVATNWQAIQYVKNPTYELQELAIPALDMANLGAYATFLRYCGYDISPKVQMAAVHNNIENVNNIPNPSKQVQAFVREHAPNLAYLINEPRKYLDYKINDLSGLLSWYQIDVLSAEKALAGLETSIKNYQGELTPVDRVTLQGLVNDKKGELKQAKDDYDQTAKELKLYQDWLAKLPIRENHELTRIKQLIGVRS
jgi:hypothetical protein